MVLDVSEDLEDESLDANTNTMSLWQAKPLGDLTSLMEFTS